VVAPVPKVVKAEKGESVSSKWAHVSDSFSVGVADIAAAAPGDSQLLCETSSGSPVASISRRSHAPAEAAPVGEIESAARGRPGAAIRSVAGGAWSSGATLWFT
jgi:hypothetical protein